MKTHNEAVQKLASAFGIPEQVLVKAIEAKELPATLKGGEYQVEAGDFNAWLASKEIPATPAA